MSHDAYVSAVISKSVAFMLREVGFEAAEVCAHRTLGSLIERYVQEIGATMAQSANAAGRTRSNENDFRAAMSEHAPPNDHDDDDDGRGTDVVQSLLRWKRDVLDPNADERDVPIVPAFATKARSLPLGLRPFSPSASSPSSSSSA